MANWIRGVRTPSAPLTLRLLLLNVALAALIFFVSELRKGPKMSADRAARLIAALSMVEHEDTGALAEDLYREALRDSTVIEHLSKALRSPNRTTRYKCISVLLRLGPQASAAIPNLVFVLDNPSEEEDVRSIAANALGQIGSAAVPFLVERLATNHALFVRKWAASALSHCRSEHAVVVPALIACFSDPSNELRGTAMSTLSNFDDSTPLPYLFDALAKSNDLSSQMAIVDTALRIDRQLGPGFLPYLAAALKSNDPDLRYEAAKIASELAESAEAFDCLVDGLMSVLHDDLEYTRGYAAIALGYCGAKSRPLTRELATLLWDESEEVRVCASQALCRLGNNAADALPFLLQAEKEDRPAREVIRLAIRSITIPR